MSTFDIKNTVEFQDYVPGCGYTYYVDGQRAIVETYGWELQSSLADELKWERQGKKPIRTIIVPLASYDGTPKTHSYNVTTWGYSMRSFHNIAEALGNKDYELYRKLAQQLVTKRY